jgi:KAP family P-loop domain
MVAQQVLASASTVADDRIILDVPAERPTLGFEQIAAALATIIRTSEPRFAVGIFGGWGSGKSSLMEEIERRVAQDSQAVIVRFNAWRYEREPHLIVPLLDTIRATFADRAATIDNVSDRERVEGVARRVGRVVRALARATSIEIGIPGAGAFGLDVGKALDEMVPKPEDSATSPQSLYYAAFEELRNAFDDFHRASISRIVVFVDDLDRCLPERALTVLESMKLFFDMPGFVFVVGLDERVVETAVHAKFASGQVENDEHLRQLEEEYLKKIFQVPYTLPAMQAGHLNQLLQWLDVHGGLSADQRHDLLQRVRKYLQWVAPEGRINPRETKRFINAYTLARMIRPELDRDTILALQAMDFRPDWGRVYEDVVLSEPDVFSQALRDLLAGDEHAFEDLWPQVGILPSELLAFLRSDEAATLQRPDLELCVSLLETTHTRQGWLKEAMREVGRLRRHLRDLPADLEPGNEAARTAANELRGVLGHLQQQTSSASNPAVRSALNRLDSLISELGSPLPTGPDAHGRETPSIRGESWKPKASQATDALQAELRALRRASTFGA